MFNLIKKKMSKPHEDKAAIMMNAEDKNEDKENHGEGEGEGDGGEGSSGGGGGPTTPALNFDKNGGSVQLYTAVLLVNAAMADGVMEDTERAQIMDNLTEHFGMCESSALEVFTTAMELSRNEDLELTLDRMVDMEKNLSEAGDTHLKRSMLRDSTLYGAAQKLIDLIDDDERRVLAAMVHQIVYADGVLDAEEAKILNGMGSLLGVKGIAPNLIRQKMRQLIKLKEDENHDEIIEDIKAEARPKLRPKFSLRRRKHPAP